MPKGSWNQDRAAVERNLPGLRRHAAMNRDRIMTDPRNRRGPQHHTSALWVLRDPAGAEWRVNNLKDWARTHAHLFGQEDGEPGAVRVCSGIQQVKQSMLGRRRNAVASYKGWTLVSWSGRADQS
ncbi:hypothetical protein [Bifidobacterium indicum]|uniref:hypothetical protein n=1 Tax=Bifidobacterium indicum TaxID=1691 RepID=UPI0030D7DAEB